MISPPTYKHRYTIPPRKPRLMIPDTTSNHRVIHAKAASGHKSTVEVAVVYKQLLPDANASENDQANDARSQQLSRRIYRVEHLLELDVRGAVQSGIIHVARRTEGSRRDPDGAGTRSRVGDTRLRPNRRNL